MGVHHSKAGSDFRICDKWPHYIFTPAYVCSLKINFHLFTEFGIFLQTWCITSHRSPLKIILFLFFQRHHIKAAQTEFKTACFLFSTCQLSPKTQSFSSITVKEINYLSNILSNNAPEEQMMNRFVPHPTNS
jgi:hypothetical protein